MRRIIFLLLLCFTSATAFCEVPTGRLFQIDRSKNSNIVCYDVNLENNSLDLNNPLDVYWIRHEEGGVRKDLSFIQRKLAYGYKVVSKGKNEATVKLIAYNKQNLRICKRNSKWVALITIKGKECVLSTIYVKAKPTNSLSVEYVELRGKSIADGKMVSDKIFP